MIKHYNLVCGLCSCPDLFIPVMYTDSDMSIVVHVHTNVLNVIRSGHMDSLYRI